MRSYLDLPADIERHYHDVCQTFERLIGKLSQPSCQSHTHGEIEELIHAEGMELLRQMVQAHLNQRSAQEAVHDEVRRGAPPVHEQHTDGRIKSRITGEGQDAGAKITGDDWDRGDHVTGTEGSSATRRNPTRRGGPIGAMNFRKLEPRNEEIAQPVSKVTGSSGNTDTGSLITYSGGARG